MIPRIDFVEIPEHEKLLVLSGYSGYPKVWREKIFTPNIPIFSLNPFKEQLKKYIFTTISIKNIYLHEDIFETV